MFVENFAYWTFLKSRSNSSSKSCGILATTVLAPLTTPLTLYSTPSIWPIDPLLKKMFKKSDVETEIKIKRFISTMYYGMMETWRISRAYAPAQSMTASAMICSVLPSAFCATTALGKVESFFWIFKLLYSNSNFTSTPINKQIWWETATKKSWECYIHQKNWKWWHRVEIVKTTLKKVVNYLE